MNPLLVILLIGAGAFALSGAGIVRTGKRLSLKLLSVDAFQIIGTEVRLSATVAIDNPTRNTLNLKQPYLKLFFNNSEIGNSLPSDKIYTIAANQRTLLKGLNLRLPFTSVPAIAVALMNNQQTTQSVILETAVTVNGILVRTSKAFPISDLVKMANKK